MKLRYYADAEMKHWHNEILRLLKTIYHEHGITVEIDRVEERFGQISDFPGEISRSSPQEVYHRDFEDNDELISNIDWPSSRPYTFGGTFQIADHIALIDDGVQWASTLQGDAYGHGPGAEEHTPIDFLEDVADSPSNRFCVECVHLLDGDETYCPTCGHELQ